MIRSFVVPAAALLALAACGSEPVADNAAAPANVSASKAPAGAAWLETVVETPEGGVLIGNPNARVKLVEYASLTCHVCADFAANGYQALLDNYVAKGSVSLEIRNYVRDPVDVAAALMTRCQGAGPYLQLTEQTFADQQAIFDRAGAISTEAQTRIGSLPQAQQYAALAEEIGLTQFYAQRGLGAQRAGQCLADPAALQELIEIKRVADEQYRIPGTPAFLINGELQNVTNWQGLEALLREAGG